MNSSGLRLLYLGFAFPPGVQCFYPGINPAGHALETQMVQELRAHFAVRSIGVLPGDAPRVVDADPDSGIPHELILVEKPPELIHRLRALRRLKQCYRQWLAGGWVPDLVLVYNLSPIYNQFLLWLRRQPRCPKLVLLLLDSPNLGQQLPWLKRFRRRCKPMCIPDSEMLRKFDACVGLSKATERYFSPREVPFLWMPGGCTPARAIRERPLFRLKESIEPIRFGYHGALGAHAGVRKLADLFISNGLVATLEICGYGKASAEFAELAGLDSRLKFLGLRTPSECLRFGMDCDVLVNPRPATHGNENNFASKLFDYALSGRAILTSRLSGVEEVLGPDAFYFDPYDFEQSLAKELYRLSLTSRSELHRRGAAIQERVIREFSWTNQGRRLAEFLERVCIGAGAIAGPTALAA